MEHLRPATHRLAKRRRADRNDHEFLNVDTVVGVCPTVDDVHHRHRHDIRPGPAEIAIQRLVATARHRFRAGERDREDRVGSQLRLVGGAVELDQGVVDRPLVARLHAAQRTPNDVLDVQDCLHDPLAVIALCIAVAQLERFSRPGRCTRRYRGTPDRSSFEPHIRLHRGIAARIDDLAGENVLDQRHSGFTRSCRAPRGAARR